MEFSGVGVVPLVQGTLRGFGGVDRLESAGGPDLGGLNFLISRSSGVPVFSTV